jgi:hypothetical protein
MCFGNMSQSGQTNQTQLLNGSQTSTPPAWLTAAAQQNLGAATNLQNAGFTPYGGQMVAGFSPQQQASFGLGTNLANSVNGGPIGTMVGNAASAGPSSVNANTIASQMSPYMTAAVMILARLTLSRTAEHGSSIGRDLLALISKVLTWPVRSPVERVISHFGPRQRPPFQSKETD